MEQKLKTVLKANFFEQNKFLLVSSKVHMRCSEQKLCSNSVQEREFEVPLFGKPRWDLFNTCSGHRWQVFHLPIFERVLYRTCTVMPEEV